MLLVDGDGRVCMSMQLEVRAREAGTTRTSWLFGVDRMKILLALLFCRHLKVVAKHVCSEDGLAEGLFVVKLPNIAL